MEYVDIHSHILPGLDDGASDREQTELMLRTAYSQGVRTICATPHFRPEMFPVSLRKRQEAFELTKNIAKDIATDLEIVLGNELYYSEDSVKYLKDGKCRCMGNTRYVLVEFSTSIDFSDMRKKIMRLISEGFIPVIAHIERYSCVRENISLVDELIGAGGYIQVNSRSIIRSSFEIRRFVRKLLKYGMVHFVASDSHNNSDRAYNFTETVAYIEKKYGRKYVSELMYLNPCRMLADEYI